MAELNKLPGIKIIGTMERDHFGRAYKSYYLDGVKAE